MLFPMYTVAADVLLKMTRVEPHEKLKARSHVAERQFGAFAIEGSGFKLVSGLRWAEVRSSERAGPNIPCTCALCALSRPTLDSTLNPQALCMQNRGWSAHWYAMSI